MTLKQVDGINITMAMIIGKRFRLAGKATFSTESEPERSEEIWDHTVFLMERMLRGNQVKKKSIDYIL